MADQSERRGFTPGPWKVLKDGEAEHTILGPDLETVCQTEFWGMPNLPETQANARLIAAAPDLYKALKVAMWYMPRSGPLRKQCKDALAKAEGRDTGGDDEG